MPAIAEVQHQPETGVQEVVRHGEIGPDELLVVQAVSVENVLQIHHKFHVRPQVQQLVRIERDDILGPFVLVVAVVFRHGGRPDGDAVGSLQAPPVKGAMDPQLRPRDELAALMPHGDAGKPAILPVADSCADQRTSEIERIGIAGDGKAVRRADPEIGVRGPGSVVVEKAVPRDQEERRVQRGGRRETPLVEQLTVRLGEILDLLLPPDGVGAPSVSVADVRFGNPIVRQMIRNGSAVHVDLRCHVVVVPDHPCKESAEVHPRPFPVSAAQNSRQSGMKRVLLAEDPRGERERVPPGVV